MNVRILDNRRRSIAIQFILDESKNMASRIARIIIIQIQFTSTFELTSELVATEKSEWGLFMRKRIAASIYIAVWCVRAFVRIPVMNWSAQPDQLYVTFPDIFITIFTRFHSWCVDYATTANANPFGQSQLNSNFCNSM